MVDIPAEFLMRLTRGVGCVVVWGYGGAVVCGGWEGVEAQSLVV